MSKSDDIATYVEYNKIYKPEKNIYYLTDLNIVRNMGRKSEHDEHNQKN
jgi:hypothetical protein